MKKLLLLFTIVLASSFAFSCTEDDSVETAVIKKQETVLADASGEEDGQTPAGEGE